MRRPFPISSTKRGNRKRDHTKGRPHGNEMETKAVSGNDMETKLLNPANDGNENAVADTFRK